MAQGEVTHAVSQRGEGCRSDALLSRPALASKHHFNERDRDQHGELGFVPDFLLGDDPEAIRRGLRGRFAALAAEVEFDALLLAHCDPIRTGGRSALRTFADAPTAGAPPGCPYG